MFVGEQYVLQQMHKFTLVRHTFTCATCVKVGGFYLYHFVTLLLAPFVRRLRVCENFSSPELDILHRMQQCFVCVRECFDCRSEKKRTKELCVSNKSVPDKLQAQFKAYSCTSEVAV